ncbi:MAG: DUF6582 domain-containing protein, partial [Candidatus Hodarchaeales archaeon]
SVMCRSCHRKYHAKLNGGKGSEEIISAVARIIDDPKTNESKAIASDHKNSDLMHVEFILCHATVNDNKDRFTSDDLKESAHTATNKPINWEHKDQNIGVIYESKFVSTDKLEDEAKAYYENIDPLEYDFVVCRACVWEYKYPMESRIMRDRASNGNLFFSMENNFDKATCSECNETFDSFYEYCDHLLSRRQTDNVSRIFGDSNFVGAAVTRNPADELAGTLALASLRKNHSVFADVCQSTALSSVSIKNEIIPYIISREADMKIRELDIPEELRSGLEKDLSNELFADDVNKVFPLDNAENVSVAAESFLNSELNFYESSEKLYIVERIAKAANEYDIEINTLIKDIEGGTESMTIDKNSPEFKQALAEALDVELKGIESGTKLAESQEELAKANEITDKTKKELDESNKAKADIQTEYEAYKTEVEKKELAEARYSTLVEKELEFENSDSVKSRIAEMDEDAFAAYVADLETVAAKAKFNFEKKKKDEEEDEEEDDDKKKKKDKKKDEAKANKEDPVKESNETAIASKVDDGTSDQKSKFPGFDAVLNALDN